MKSKQYFFAIVDEERHYYKIPDPVTTDEEFDKYVNTYGKSSFETHATMDKLITEPYKVRSNSHILNVILGSVRLFLYI